MPNSNKTGAEKKKSKSYSADMLMMNVVMCMIRDVRRNLADPTRYNDLYEACRNRNVRAIRDAVPTLDLDVDSYTFKCDYQIQSVLKRYRFEKDVYTDAELERLAIAKFITFQEHLRKERTHSEITRKVIQYARQYIYRTLGSFSPEEHSDKCRFGRKASVGIPARAACEAARWGIPITGSGRQIEWFRREIANDVHAQEYLAAQEAKDPSGSRYAHIVALKLTLVPKTFKSFRTIVPNSTIGSYMTHGLGIMIRSRLKKKGYDIATLQQRHRILARSASLYNHNVTADLSSASDTISTQMVEQLFPPCWFKILTDSRIGWLTLPKNHGEVPEMETFCTMGVGFTFPLQTLVFLSLLKAIEFVDTGKWNKLLISVYGDDLIYHESLHTTMQHVFKELGFVVNVDKTFASGPFRESCGGDYHHGRDVRPFQPQNGQAHVRSFAYEAMLYKFINGILFRWTEHEMCDTVRFLYQEVESLVTKIKLVPKDYPDDAGVQVSLPLTGMQIQSRAICVPKFLGHGIYRFPYLRFIPAEEKEVRHEPYYWVRLRGLSPDHDIYDGRRVYGFSHIATAKFLETLLGSSPRQVDEACGVSDNEPLLITKRAEPHRTVRSCITGRRLKCTETFVTLSHTGRYTRQSGTSCFEDLG